MTRSFDAPQAAARCLRYTRPAANFNEALPIGNGRLGAMVYGGIVDDRISLNDDRLWAGHEPPAPNPEGPDLIERSRKLFLDGERKAAQQLLEAEFTTDFPQPYLPAGTLRLRWDQQEDCTHYERTLDLATACAGYNLIQDKVTRQAEVLASYEDDVIAVRFHGTGGTLPDLEIGLDSPLRHDVSAVGQKILLTGRAPSRVRWSEVDDATTDDNRVTYDEVLSRRFAIGVEIVCTDGQVTAGTGRLAVRDATEIVVLIALATDARSSDPGACVETDLLKAAKRPYDLLRSRHVAAYRDLYDRVSLQLAPATAGNEATDKRLGSMASGELDTDLLAMIFDYGRYLMISASRPGSMPTNLQGIWNERVDPPWWSNFTLNINQEMHYWLVGNCGLPECAEPLFDFIEALSEKGKETARVMYGARGWLANHMSDYRLQTTPLGRLDHRVFDESAKWALWPFGGAWLCLHLYDHYDFTRDEAFLKRALPLMRGAAEFMLDWLVDDPEQEGDLTTLPSTSPENTYRYKNDDVCALTKGSTMDIAIIRALFTRCLDVLAVTGDNGHETFAQEVREALARLPDTPLSSDGRILEFDGDWLEAEHPHRHISHLFDLCPHNRITLEGTPDLAEAARRSLQYRGDSGTGWSLAWKARCQARLKNGGKALKHLKDLLTPVSADHFSTGHKDGGLYPNLLAACPPFNIDGNFGYVAALTEMFVQDHAGFIDILPACPAELASGEIRDFHLRGNQRISFAWQGGTVIRLSLEVKTDMTHRILVNGIEHSLTLTKGENVLDHLLQERPLRQSRGGA